MLNGLISFQKTYGMEVTKPFPFLTMYEDPKHIPNYNSPACFWREVKNRVIFNKIMEKRRHFSLLGDSCTSLLKQQKSFSLPEEPTVNSCLHAMPHYPTWKPIFQGLRFLAQSKPCAAAESDKSIYILNASVLRDITQKLINIFHLQHICHLVNQVFESCEAYRMKNEVDVDSVKMNGDAQHFGRSIGIHSMELIDTEVCGSRTQTKIVSCDSRTMYDKKNAVNNLSDSSSIAVETLHRVKSTVQSANKEMISRKQRQINKHSKKRKRRMRKKNKNSSPEPSAKRIVDIKEERHLGKSSQTKREGPKLSSSSAARTVLDDWEDSDEDLCIVFEDEVDHVVSVLPKSTNSQCNGIEQMSDLWIEFDSFTIVSDSGGATVERENRSSEILIHCDSDSEYEEESGEIFVDSEEFDSWPGLFFLNDGSLGCSGLQNAVHDQGVMPRTPFYELPLVSDDAGTCEIRKINKRWEEMTSDLGVEPHLSQRVTFAPEEDLVAVFPVEMIDRKSEWEQFALERFRFKRRVDEFEKIITPYFTPAHRQKIYRRLGTAVS